MVKNHFFVPWVENEDLEADTQEGQEEAHQREDFENSGESIIFAIDGGVERRKGYAPTTS